MIINVEDPTARIALGMQGEHLACPVSFDVSAWASEYGLGAVQLLVQRNRDTVPYPVETRAEGTLIHWDVTRYDTAAAGLGAVQLLYLVDGKVAKSRRIGMYVGASLGADPPNPDMLPGWADQVLQASADAKQAASQAETAKQAAEAATVHMPQIQAGTWHVWDMDQGKYVDTGVAATEPGPQGEVGPQGKTGKAPVRGVDYWTEQDKQQLVKDTLAALPKWDGTYVVTPKAEQASVLQTSGKVMAGDVVVEKVPYYDTSNAYGNTIYIASEVQQ